MVQQQTAVQIGLPRDPGWQVGVRKTLAIAPEDAWEFLLSEKIVRIWLGAKFENTLQAGSVFFLDDGTQINITVFNPGSYLSLLYQPRDYPQPTFLQVCLIPSGENTTFAFHQEFLPDREARQERKFHFQQVLDDFECLLDNEFEFSS